MYFIFTFDCKANLPGNVIMKFADDTIVTGFINGDECNYRNEVESVVNYCNSNNLHLNVAKELLIDFRKGIPPPLL